VRDALVKLNNGREVPEEEVGRFMRCFALDADGTVDEEHFVAGWHELEEVLKAKNMRIDRLVDIFHYDLEGTILRELRVAFDSLDNKHHGLITPESLTRFPQLQLSLPEAEALIDALDASGAVGGEKKHSVTFEDFVHGVIKADLLRRHPLVSRLQRLGALFDVVDRTYARTYIVNGFTVAGMRDTIQAKLLRPHPELRTQFAVGETGEYLHGDYTDPNGRRLMVGVLLQPAATGYTKVLAYRISGRTDVFHAWFHLFRLALHAEICQCLEDTSVVGESEGI
jgi:Ca2+-binding EF-hand superfamily protein